MKPTSVTILSLLFLFPILSFSQECGTAFFAGEDPTIAERMKDYTSTRSGNIINIATSIHILRENGVAPIDYKEIIDELARVNELLIPSGFQLISCAPYYIDDNNFTSISFDNDLEFHNKYSVPGTVNIYFVENLLDFCGWSTLPWWNPFEHRIFMRNSCAFRSTLAHEVGHHFGLYHTHEDTFGEEFVNGSNCNSAGDLLCDTPADPRLSANIVNEKCNYFGPERDFFNERYEPNTANLMSYSRASCRDHFSNEQLLKMEIYKNDMFDLYLLEEDCGGIDLSITSNNEANLNFGETASLPLQIKTEGLQETTQTEVIIFSKDSDNTITELINFEVRLVPGQELNINRAISLSSFFVGREHSLIAEINPNLSIPEAFRKNNSIEIPIGSSYHPIQQAQFSPSPSSDFVTALFRFPSASQPVVVEIYNQIGQLVQTEKGLESAGDEYFFSLNIIDYPSGIYFARFRWPNDKIDILRFQKI